TSTEYYKNAEELDKPLDVAIAIGVEPSLILASTVWLPFGDKISFAGSLRGKPVELVTARKVDLKVPAHAMIILEGKILPKVRQTEGPFGESTGYYITSNNPVIKVELIAHQENPVYAVFEPWSKDDEGAVTVSIGAEILKSMKATFPSVQDLRLVALGTTVIFSMKQRNHNEARSVLFWILSGNHYIKKAVAVDDDVDIYNLEEVEWALSSRFQAARDIIIMNELPGSPIDPSVGDYNITSKLGMDATKPLDQKDRYEKIKVPEKSMKKARLILKRYL
ncbi:MAG: UbiD family decarboxylase, partial [Thermodesulfobacteriota bacterium]|nr:UbiD family decarboxylase [Thermodesulfobacteriota bacterium]